MSYYDHYDCETTHSRSSLYIYKNFEHLQQWLLVIRVLLLPIYDVLDLTPKCVLVHGFALGSSVTTYDWQSLYSSIQKKKFDI